MMACILSKRAQYLHDQHMYISVRIFNSCEPQIFSVVEDSDQYITLILLEEGEIPEPVKQKKGEIL